MRQLSVAKKILFVKLCTSIIV